MRDFLLDIFCFIALAGALEACTRHSADEVDWANANYVEGCEMQHADNQAACHPHEDDMGLISGRGRSGGKR